MAPNAIYNMVPEEPVLGSSYAGMFVITFRSVYKELHADRETGY